MWHEVYGPTDPSEVAWSTQKVKEFWSNLNSTCLNAQMRTHMIKELKSALESPQVAQEHFTPLTSVARSVAVRRDSAIKLPSISQPNRTTRPVITDTGATGIDGPARRRPAIIELSDSSDDEEDTQLSHSPKNVATSPTARPPVKLNIPSLLSYLEHLKESVTKKIIVLTGPTGCSKLSTITALLNNRPTQAASKAAAGAEWLTVEATNVTISTHHSLELGDETSAFTAIGDLRRALEAGIQQEHAAMESFTTVLNQALHSPMTNWRHENKKNSVLVSAIKDLPVRGTSSGSLNNLALQQTSVLEQCYQYAASLVLDASHRWDNLLTTIKTLYGETEIPFEAASRLYDAIQAQPACDSLIILIHTIHDTHSEKVGLRAWLPPMFTAENDGGKSSNFFGGISPVCMQSIPAVTDVMLLKQMARVLELVRTEQQRLYGDAKWASYNVEQYLASGKEKKSSKGAKSGVAIKNNPILETIAAASSGDVRQALLQLQWACLKTYTFKTTTSNAKVASRKGIITLGSFEELEDEAWEPSWSSISTFESAAAKCTWMHYESLQSNPLISKKDLVSNTELESPPTDTILALFRNETLELAHATARLLTQRYSLESILDVLPSSSTNSSSSTSDCPPHKILDYFMNNMSRYYDPADNADGTRSQLDTYALISATASLVDPWIPSPQQGLMRTRDSMAYTVNVITQTGEAANARLHDSLGLLGLATVVSAYRALHIDVKVPLTFAAVRPPPYFPQCFPKTITSSASNDAADNIGTLDPLKVAAAFIAQSESLIAAVMQTPKGAAGQNYPILTGFWAIMRALVSPEKYFIGTSPEVLADAAPLIASILYPSSQSDIITNAGPSLTPVPQSQSLAYTRSQTPIAPKRTLLVLANPSSGTPTPAALTPIPLSQSHYPPSAVEGVVELMASYVRHRYTKPCNTNYAWAKRYGSPLNMMISPPHNAVALALAAERRMLGIAGEGPTQHRRSVDVRTSSSCIHSRFVLVDPTTYEYQKLEVNYYTFDSTKPMGRQAGLKSDRSSSPIFLGDAFASLTTSDIMVGSGESPPPGTCGWISQQGLSMLSVPPIGMGLFEASRPTMPKASDQREEIEDIEYE